MSKPMVAVLMLSLTACGGGGSTSGAAAVLVQQAQNSSAQSTGVMPASIGTVAAGYIACDTAANIAAGNDCNHFANFADGAFAFTAIAATAAGAPIADQTVNGSALAFPNGSYRVVESSNDSPAIVSIDGGPWSTPGTALTGSGGSYGNRFFVRCQHLGTASLRLELVSGPTSAALPFATAAFQTNNTTVNCSASGTVTIF
jgi:hypothetical protein